MIDEILSKVKNNEELTDSELLELFEIDNESNLKKLLKVASDIRSQNYNEIKLTSTIHLTNKCLIEPKCKYCGFAAKTSSHGYYNAFYKSNEEILEAAKCVEKSGIPRISCSGGYGYKGKQGVNAVKIIKENTNLETLVNVGADLNEKSVNQLKEYNADTICINLETTNKELFKKLKPGDSLEDRINACEMVCNAGLELSSGLLIGIGESYQDRINHLRFLKRFKTLGEIPIMGFHPYKDTPMENVPVCPVDEQLKTIAITRILYPKIRITAPTPTIGPENVEYSLNAGASNLATVIPEDYPLYVRGVGSPEYGNLTEVVNVIDSLGLGVEGNIAVAAK